MRRTTLSVLSALAILLSGMIVPEAAAQSRRDKEQTYVLEKPYEVKKLVPPTGKKIKNVILMIGDGMSLMHMYSAWTANRGKLWLDNSPIHRPLENLLRQPPHHRLRSRRYRTGHRP